MTRHEKIQTTTIAASALAIIGIVIYLALRPAPPIHPPGAPSRYVKVETGAELVDAVRPAEVNDAPPTDVAFGYERNDDAVAAFDAASPRRFNATPAGQVEEIPPFVYLWKIHEALLSRPPPEKDQNPVGSCVAFGGTTAIERSEASEIWQRTKRGQGNAKEFTFFVEEAGYAGSRVEVNGGRSPIQPNWQDKYGDGSNGGWFATWATKYGMLPRGVYGSYDLRVYDPKIARAWQFKGVPDELELECAKYKVADAVRIQTWSDLKRAVANGYGVAICSNQGFNGQRDENGVAQPGPTWAHCMCCDGYHTAPDGKEYGHIENSWAKTNYHKGPVGWGNPTNSGFWADAKTINRMLSGNGNVAYAYSGVKGFPVKPVDEWWITVPRTRGTEVAANSLAPKEALSCFGLAW